jgi:isocitrate dehydrogenase
VAKLLHAAGGAATALSASAEESLLYHTGEITMAGTLTCSACGHKLRLKATSVVPTCSECEGTSFRKSY